MAVKTKCYVCILLFVFLFTAANCVAQESTSKPEPSAGTSASGAAQSGPGSALSNALAAACSQNQAEFTRFLTVRNKESFSRMTPAARVALMKRFVLLDEPGKSTISANPSGRANVRRQTAGRTVQKQVGRADLRHNRPVLPLEPQQTAGPTRPNRRQNKIGFVREESDWKLLSLG